MGIGCRNENEHGACPGVDDCVDEDELVCVGSTPTAEVCNFRDDDCDGDTDPAGSDGCVVYYADTDGDFYGVDGTGLCLCRPEAGHTVPVAGDCDDTLIAVHPLATEVCNGRDDDCDGDTDEGVLSECGDCDGRCSVANVGAGGDEPFTPGFGNASGVWTDAASGLVLDPDHINLHFIWIANTDEDTVSQLNTITGAEEGRYRVCDDPSRTAVDLFGNMYVGCREDDGVAKVILDRDLCEDRNGNGAIETAVDLDGDFQVTGSELLPLGEDECVAWIVYPHGGDVDSIPRAVAVDRFNRPWVGYYSPVPGQGYTVQQLDPATGAVLQEVTGLAAGVYGLAIDHQGRIWASGRGAALEGRRLLRIDPEATPPTHSAYLPPTDGPGGDCFDPYGIVVDHRDRVWLGNSGCPHVFRYDPAGDAWLAVRVVDEAEEPMDASVGKTRGIAANKDGLVVVAHHSWECELGRSITTIDADSGKRIERFHLAEEGVVIGTVGLAFDYRGKLWAVNRCTNTAMRINPITGTVTHTQRVGLDPYTYSDMTGYNLHVFTAPNGYYRHTIAGWPQYGTRWVSLDVGADIPQNTYIDVRLRAAPTVTLLRSQQWSDFLGPFPPEALPFDLSRVPGGLDGDYLEVELWMFSRESGTTPTVWSVDVQYTALEGPG